MTRTRTIIAALAGCAIALAGCGIENELPQFVGDPAPAEEQTHPGIPLGFHLYDADTPGDCYGLDGIAVLPCRDVLGVCLSGTPMWMPEVYVCTAESASLTDVCNFRPEVEWWYYGLDPSECAARVES